MNAKKIIIRSAFFSYSNILLITLFGIISQPLLLRHFDTFQFGIWTITLTILTYLGNSNVGIPPAVIVLMAKALNENEKKKIILKSIVLLFLCSLLIFILCIVVNVLFTNWISIFGDVPDRLINTAKYTIIISILLLLLRVPFQIAQAAFSGYQDIHIAKMYDLFTTSVPFISLLITVKNNLSLVDMAAMVGVGLTLVNIAGVVHLFIKYKIQKLDNNYRSTTSYKQILHSGYEFFFMGIATAIIFNTDYLVISNVIGAEQIAPYAFAYKLYNMPMQIFGVLVGIVFPMFGKYFAEKNFKWVQSMYSALTSIFPILGGAVWVGGFVLSHDLIDLWSGNPDTFGGFLLIFALGGVTYSSAVVSIHSTLLGGIDKKKEVVRLIWVEGLSNLILSIVLGHFLGIGGVALGTLISSLLVPFTFLPRYVYKNSNQAIRFQFTLTIKHLALVIAPFLIIGYGIILWFDIGSVGILMRFIISISLVCIYMIASYIILPNDAKKFILARGNMLIKKFMRFKTNRGIKEKG